MYFNCVFNATAKTSEITSRWHVDTCVVIQKWLSAIKHSGSGIRTKRSVILTDRWWLPANILIRKWRPENQVKSPITNNTWLHSLFFSFQVSKTCGKFFRYKPYTVQRRLSERQLSGTSNIRTNIFFVKIFSAFLFFKKKQNTVTVKE